MSYPSVKYVSFETVEEVINLLEIAFKNKFGEEMYQYILSFFFQTVTKTPLKKKNVSSRYFNFQT